MSREPGSLKVNMGGRGQLIIRKVFNCGFRWNGLSSESLTGWVQSLRSQGGPFLGGLQYIQAYCIGECRGRGNPFVEVEVEVTTFGA